MNPPLKHKFRVGFREKMFGEMLTHILEKIFIGCIRFYQTFISPSFPQCCRFYPTCSEYAIAAIRRHGPFKGFVISLFRLLRCNPLNPGGYDPVK